VCPDFCVNDQVLFLVVGCRERGRWSSANFGIPKASRKSRTSFDAVPLFYLVFWATSVPKHTLRWQHAPWWLTYPFAYLLWGPLRGSPTGIYPYPFLDLRALGPGRVLVNVLILMCVFLTLGLVLVAFGRWRARRTTSS
jgi:hypothetical protein